MKLVIDKYYIKLYTSDNVLYNLTKHDDKWYYITHDIGGADLMSLRNDDAEFVEKEYKKQMRERKLKRINE